MIETNSLKYRLFAKIASLISVVLLIISVVSFFNTRHEVEEVSDAELVKYSKILLNLVEHEIMEHEDDKVMDIYISKEEFFHDYEFKIHSQIWKGDRLIYNSDSNITNDKPSKEGFEDVDINQESWRSFAFYDAASDLTIEVLENYEVREELIQKILFSIFLPIFLSFIPIFMVIVVAINKGLEPLTKLSKEISAISPFSLKPFRQDNFPLEIKPLVNSLNTLLLRISELIEAERKFTDHAAHELRTPIAAIRAQAQLIHKYQNNENNEDLNDLIKGIDRASHLIDQLLSLSRLEAEKESIKNSKVNFKNCIEEIAKRYYKMAQKKDLKFNFNLDDGCEILANIYHVEIMISNLIDNAVKYSQSHAVIDISLRKENKDMVIEIINLGEEVITKENLEKLFERFYRIKNSKELGCGLGLSIVKKIAEIYGGKVDFIVDGLVNKVKVKLSS